MGALSSAMTLLQVEEELDWLAEIVRREGVCSLLEIGSKFGESLHRLATAMPARSHVVSVDLPGGTKMWRSSEKALQGNINDLQSRGYDAHVIWGSSFDPVVIEQVRALGPYDMIFIDADHRLPGVTKDWENYGPMGRMIAFHDIAWRRAPEWEGVRIDVPQFWDSIKGDYHHEEIRACPTGKNNGIGVLWREC